MLQFSIMCISHWSLGACLRVMDHLVSVVHVATLHATVFCCVYCDYQLYFQIY